MRHRISALAAALVMTVVISTGIAQADTDLEAIKQAMGASQRIIDEMYRIGQILSEAKAPVRQAVGFAVMGMHSYSLEDARLNAQALVNVLEGPESEVYDPALDVLTDFDKGIRPLLETLKPTMQLWSGIEDETSSDGMEDGWDRFLSLFRLASKTMQNILPFGEATAQEVADAFLTTYALLSFAQDGITSMLQMWGFEIWVSPGESIQAAIDTAREGARIFIEPGIYRETIEISKSLVLTVGWVRDPIMAAERPSGGVIIQPIDSQVGIIVRSQDSIEVLLQWIEIRDAVTGISASGNARLTMEHVSIDNSDTGIMISEYVTAVLTGCLFTGNGIGVLARGDSNVSVNECHIEGSTSSLGGVIIQESASMSMEGTRIVNGEGNGILLAETGSLTLIDGLISHNAGDGILLVEETSLHVTGTSFYSNSGFGIRTLSPMCLLSYDGRHDHFKGSVTGEGNWFVSKDTLLSNILGGFCPPNLGFLTKRSE